MVCGGISAPTKPPHGQGRKYHQPVDHYVTRLDVDDPQVLDVPQVVQGRKQFIEKDSVKTEVMNHGGDEVIVMTPGEMKDAVQEALHGDHGMVIFERKKWDDVTLVSCGTHWTIEALTQQMKTINRIGLNGKALADKLSLMSSAELRHFGIRFGVKNPATDFSLHTGKARVNDVNPSFSSTGVHGSIKFGCIDDPNLAAGDKDVRQFTPSDQKNTQELLFDSKGTVMRSRGHVRADDRFKGSMVPEENDKGRSRGYIGSRDSLFGANWQEPGTA